METAPAPLEATALAAPPRWLRSPWRAFVAAWDRIFDRMQRRMDEMTDEEYSDRIL